MTTVYLGNASLQNLSLSYYFRVPGADGNLGGPERIDVEANTTAQITLASDAATFTTNTWTAAGFPAWNGTIGWSLSPIVL